MEEVTAKDLLDVILVLASSIVIILEHQNPPMLNLYKKALELHDSINSGVLEFNSIHSLALEVKRSYPHLFKEDFPNSPLM